MRFQEDSPIQRMGLKIGGLRSGEVNAVIFSAEGRSLLGNFLFLEKKPYAGKSNTEMFKELAKDKAMIKEMVRGTENGE